MKLSPHRLTHAYPVLAFAVWLGLVTSTWPRAHPVLYLQDSPRAWLHLNAFRGEPAISTFDWHFTPIHSSSPSRGTFRLSLTVLVHYRSLKVLSLGGWSPQLPTNSPGFVVLRIPVGSHGWTRNRALTVSGQAFQPVGVHPS